MRFTWMLVAVLAAVAAVQATELEDKVKETIEGFRSIMATGSEELDVPILEPVSIAQIPLHVKVSPFHADVVASNIVVSGASGFKITKITQQEGTNKVTVAAEVPSIDVTGDYDIKGKVKVGFINIKLNNKGPLTVTLRNLKGDGVAEVQENADGSLHINNIKINTWKYDKLQIKMKNLAGVVVSLVNTLVPSFVKSNRAKINNLAETIGQQFINKYLDKIAGKQSSLQFHYEPIVIEADKWIVTEEAQDMLNQLATMIAAEDESSDLASLTAKLLEEFKAIMKTGRPDFAIPVLDPAVIDSLPMDVKHGPFNAKIVATESQVQGVSDFTVANIEQVDGTNTVQVDLAVSEIDIVGKFDMKGKVKIGIFYKNLNDQGPLALTLKGVKLSAAVEILANADGSYNVQKITTSSWSYDSIHIQLDNLLGGGSIGKIANNLFNDVFPTLVESDRSNINSWLNTMGQKLFNKYLDGLAGKESADLEAKIKDLSEIFRIAMKNGRQDLNIPVMDPAEVAQLPVHIKQWPFESQLTASNIKVMGASDFTFTRVSQVYGTNKVAVDFTVPTISVESDYNLDSTFKIGFIKFNFNRQGPLKAALHGLKGSARAEVVIEADNSLSLVGLQVDSWTFEAINIDVDNLGTGNFFQKYLNSLINNFVPSVLVKPNVDELSAWAGDQGSQVISRFLDAVAGRVILPDLDTRAAKLLEELQTVLKSGSTDYNMPVLDPASIDQVPFSFNDKLIDATIIAKEIVVKGTSTYTITKVSQIEGTNKVTVELLVPEIVASGKFDATGNANFWVKKVPFEDHGSVEATISGLTAKATATLSENISGDLSLKELKIKSWTYNKIKTSFGNMQNNLAGKLLNQVINNVLPAVIKLQEDTLTAWAETTATVVLDEFLSGVAAKSATHATVHIENISDEALEIMSQLAVLAVRAGLAQAA